MKGNSWALWGLLCLAGVFCLACGGQADKAPGDAGKEAKQEQAAKPEKTAKASKAETPEEVGKAIGAIYVEAMNKVIDMGKDQPPAEELKPKLAEYKEECVDKLVELGKTKEGFTDEQKAKVNSLLRMKMGEVNMDMFTEFSNICNSYMDKDKETYDLLASFNVITQYADFDLLKKQEPEEAQRLGIE